jgi:hypothetical protein
MGRRSKEFDLYKHSLYLAGKKNANTCEIINSRYNIHNTVEATFRQYKTDLWAHEVLYNNRVPMPQGKADIIDR